MKSIPVLIVSLLLVYFSESHRIELPEFKAEVGMEIQ